MARLKDSTIAFLTADEIQKIVRDMAKVITNDYAGKEIVVVCPLKGSSIFCADLCRLIDLPQQIDFVYLKATEKKGAISLLKDISVNIHGKHVLVVEEIIDVGRSLSFLKTRLAAAQPASIRIAALLDKPARRELPIKPDYVGMTIDDRYMIGYGMDSEEIGRNYRDLSYFKQ